MNATESVVTNESNTSQQVSRPLHSNVLSLININICGLDKSDNRRQCSSHCCCGHFVKEGDILLLKTVTEHLIIEGVHDDCLRTMVKAYKINNEGIRSCHIGFWQVAQEAFNGKLLIIGFHHTKLIIVCRTKNMGGYDYTKENPCDVSN